MRFYLVAILFIIFDLEVAFLFPWAISLGDVGMFGFWSMILFLGVLTVGFIYEWKRALVVSITSDTRLEATLPVGTDQDAILGAVGDELRDKGFAIAQADKLFNWRAAARFGR